MKAMTFTLVIPLAIGWVSGWIVNYLADVLPVTRRLSHPACAQCGHPYRLADYLLLRPCRECGHRRGWRPWLVQLAMLAVSLYTWTRPHAMGYALGILVLTYFGLVVVIDMEHRLILHPTSIVGALLAVGIGLRIHGLQATLLGGLVALIFMLALYYGGVLFSKYRARRMRAAGKETDAEEALGAGDVILATILGLLIGWSTIVPALVLGILLAGVVGIILVAAMIIRGLYGKQALMVFMPYGPYFILSAFIILFLPNWITGVLGR